MQFFTSHENGTVIQQELNGTDLANETNVTAADSSKPIFFGMVIDSLRGRYPDYLGVKFEAYFYATAVVLASAFNVMLMHPYLLSQMHLGMKMRLALCSAIYRKSLRLSKNALGETTVGQVVNLLSNDVGRLDIAIIFLHFLWVGPIETMLITYLMYLKVRMGSNFIINRFALNFVFFRFSFVDWSIRNIWCYFHVTVHPIPRIYGKKDVCIPFENRIENR